MLAKHQVSGNVTRCPRTEKGPRVGTQLIEQIGELRTFHVVEGETDHVAEA